MTKGRGMQAAVHGHPRSAQRAPARQPSRGPPPAHAWGIAAPSPSTRARGCSAAVVWSRICDPPTADQWVRRHGRPAPACCTALCWAAVSHCTPVLVVPSCVPASRPATPPPPRVPEGYSSLRAGLLLAVCSFETVSHAQRGQSGTERMAAVCFLSPSPRHDRRVSCPAQGTAGCGEALAGVYVKRGFIFPILAGRQWEWQGWR